MAMWLDPATDTAATTILFDPRSRIYTIDIVSSERALYFGKNGVCPVQCKVIETTCRAEN
jgi:hypothetical protein